MKLALTLEDGRQFSGEGLGANSERIGEVIFNTAVVGYQEMLTDPANAGKILILTYPLIGNYGIAPQFNQSKKCWVSGLVIKENSRIYSNWQAKHSLEDFAKEQNLCVLHKIDTRTLMVHLRNKGEMWGAIAGSSVNPKDLLSKIQAAKKRALPDYISKASTAKPYWLGPKNAKYRLALLDCGVTASVVAQLVKLGLGVLVLPFDAKPQEILKAKVRGLVISGGPEQDQADELIVENIRNLIGKIPLLGLTSGHQKLAQALGAKVVRMKLGHRGVNYPIYRPGSYKGEITAQNHGQAVEAESLSRIKGIKITGYNLNDRTIEEMESKTLKLLGVQYSPASPGLGEVSDVFKRFLKLSKA